MVDIFVIFISSFFSYVIALFFITYLIQFVKQTIDHEKEYHFKNKWLDKFTFIFGIMYAIIVTVLTLNVWSKI